MDSENYQHLPCSRKDVSNSRLRRRLAAHFSSSFDPRLRFRIGLITWGLLAPGIWDGVLVEGIRKELLPLPVRTGGGGSWSDCQLPSHTSSPRDCWKMLRDNSVMALSNLNERVCLLLSSSNQRRKNHSDLVLPGSENFLALERRAVGPAVGAIRQTRFLGAGEKQGFHSVLLIQSKLGVRECVCVILFSASAYIKRTCQSWRVRRSRLFHFVNHRMAGWGNWKRWNRNPS